MIPKEDRGVDEGREAVAPWLSASRWATRAWWRRGFVPWRRRPPRVIEDVKAIVDDVRAQGDAALLRYVEQFDGVEARF
jgi:hypothetical protein